MKRDPSLTTQVLLALALAGLVLLYSTPRDDAWAGGGAPVPALDCPSCDDLDPCTLDSCDTSSGTCRHDPRSCDDGNPCSVDSCINDPQTGRVGCFNIPLGDGTPCEDGNSCTQGDACGAGVCVGVLQAAGSRCDDGNACTRLDACSDSGQCVGSPGPPGHPCDDGSRCTSGDACEALPTGEIVCRGQVVDCSDGDPCTLDACDPATGGCASGPVDCDDGNACTADSCDPATGACVRSGLSGPCEDGDHCTLGDFCSGGNCLPGGGAPDCDDGRECTTDVCDRLVGCRHLPGAPVSCDDGNPCTSDFCGTSGHCEHLGVSGTSCDANGASDCKIEECVLGSCRVVLFVPAGIACDDNNTCTTGDVCGNAGNCIGAPVDCNDGNPCTIDSCDPATGACLHRPGGGACDDGNACTTGETCTDGVCGGGAPVTCGAASECFANVCDPALGCVLQPRIGQPCNGGNLCFTGVCNTGGCELQVFLCDDHNPCTIDSCQDESTGACGNAPVSCDDGRSCTIDSCNPTSGCVHAYDARLPDTDLDGLPDSCDNCPTTANRLQHDCNGNGIGDACDPSLYDVRIRTTSPLGKGSGEVVWSTVCESDLRGFNVVMLDNQGRRTQLNFVPIPCTECITAGSAAYSTLIPKHKSARNVYLEVLHRTAANLTVGPAVKE